ncbi:MAG TPA: hypothetical protein EYQ42_10645 [Thiotrichaceae bacterium]|jgi:hypothetical protein|nr:hypothetical protein [Thiotrichaceae bacterium]HIM07258.1 hypothetical protein [Gammaproteobacteria bacterium]
MQLVNKRYRLKKNEFDTETSLQNENVLEAAAEENKKLFCKNCKNHITNIDAAISIDGAHTHTFKNPADYEYTISCYQTAVGCLVSGEPTNEYTWFKHYQWQLAFCNACGDQLGWLFSNEQQFYALIVDRLIDQY